MRLALVSMLALAGCASLPSAPVPVAEGSSFLWRATLPGKPGVVHVLGTVHVGSEQRRLDGAVARAVVDAERLVFELHPDKGLDGASAMLQRYAYLPEGTSLPEKVSPEAWQVLQDRLESSGLVLPLLERMRAWFAVLNVSIGETQLQGLGASGGIETIVQDLGRREPSRVRSLHGLETAEEQIEALVKSAEAATPDELLMSLAETPPAQASDLVEAYMLGKEAIVVASIDTSMDATQTELLLDRRNVLMAERTLPYFEQPGQTLVAVGAAHLFGPKGLVALLQAEGATVERVPRAGPPPEAWRAYIEDREEIYRAEDVGLNMLRLAPIQHTHEGVFGMGVHVYAQSVGAAQIVITVLKLPVEMNSGVQTKMAVDMLERLGFGPAQHEQRRYLVGLERPAHQFRAGAARAWAAAGKGLPIVVLSFSLAKEPRPEEQEAVERILDSLQVVDDDS